MRSSSKYSKQKESEIRFTLMSAMQELATFSGVDINTMKETTPYSFVLSNVTSQKIAAELKKLVDTGMVVKGSVRGKTVKYMLRQTYLDLVEEGKISKEKFGYGDYRDNQPKVECEKNEDEEIVNRIKAAASRVKYEDMW